MIIHKNTKLSKLNLIIEILFSLIIFFCNIAWAGTPQVTYQGRILTAGGSPVARAVQFKLQVRSPGSEDCILYEEVQNQDLTSTNGVFSLALNSVASTRTDGGAYSFSQIFANRGTFTLSSGKCTTGTTYVTGATDNRNLKVYFNDGSGWESLPLQAINQVPLAVEAAQVGGYPASSILRVDNGSAPGTASALTAANFSELIDLITGVSTQYTKASSNGTTVLPQSTSPSSLSAGQLWYDSGLVKYYDGSSTHTLGTTSGTITYSQLPVGTASNTVAAGNDTRLVNAIQNAGYASSIQVGADAALPTNHVVGRFYVASDTQKIYYDNGTVWITIGLGNVTSVSSGTVTTALGYTPVRPSSNLSDLTSSSTARTNLGLGTLATLSTLDLASFTSGVLPVTSLPSSGVTSGTYGANNAVPTISVDIYGRITGITSNAYQYADTINYGIMRVPTGSNLTLSSGDLSLTANNVVSALGYIPASATASSQWTTSGTSISYTSGSVGIGTSSPLATIDVTSSSSQVRINHSSSTTPTFLDVNSTGTSFWSNNVNSSNNIIDTSKAQWRMALSQASDAFSIQRGGPNTVWSPSTLFTLTASGSVGIGTSSPSQLLEVNGAAQFTQSIVSTGSSAQYTSSSTTQTAPTAVQVRVSNTSNINNAMAQLYMTVNNSSNLTQRGYVGLSSTAGAAAYTPSLVFGLQSGSSSYNERMRIDSSGNVGIGTVSPSFVLDVSGTIRSTAGYRFPDGTTQTTAYTGSSSQWATSGTSLNYTSGSIGIGNSNPSTALDVSGVGTFGGNSTNGGLKIISSTGGLITNLNSTGVGAWLTAQNLYGTNTVSGSLILDSTSNATKGNIILAPSGGFVGLGTSNPAYNLDVSGSARVAGSFIVRSPTTAARTVTTSASDISLYSYSTGTYPTLSLRYSTGSSVVNSGDTLGMINFQGNNTTWSANSVTNIFSQAESTFTDTSMPSRLAFSTTPTGSVTPVERMTIDSTGRLGLGTSAPTHAITLPSTTTGFAVYNTSDQTTNYERFVGKWSGNAFLLGNEIGGSASSRVLQVGTSAAAGGNINRTLNISGGTPFFSYSFSATGLAGYTMDIGGGNTFQGTNVSQGTLSITPTVSQGGTSSFRGMFVSPYLVASGSGSNYLLDVGTNTAASGAGTHSSKFAIMTSGKVGIGTSSPAVSLDIVGDLYMRAGSGFGHRGALHVTDATSYDLSTNYGYITFSTATTNGGSTSEKVRVAQNGYVGIATTSPSYSLDVSGTINTNTGYRFPDGTVQTTAYTGSSGGGAVSSVTSANSYLTVANSTTTPIITANVGTAANTLAAGNDSRITGALQSSNNLSDLASSSTARANLGLGNSGVTAGTYGSSSAVPTFTVDALGRITSVTSNAYQYATTINYGILRVPSGSNLTVSSGDLTLTASNVVSALGYTPAASGNATSQWTTGASNIYYGGNVQIGNQTVRSTSSARGQLGLSSTYSQTSAGSVSVNWDLGNMQEISTYVCNGTNTITFTNLNDGGAYTLLLSGSASHVSTCLFSASGLTFKTPAGAVAPVSGKDVLFTFTRIGSTVIYSMSDNLQ